MVKAEGNRVMRFQKPGGVEAAFIYDPKTGQNITVWGEMQDALEARAFQDAIASGRLPVPKQEVKVQQPRPRRAGRNDGLPDLKPDADSISPEQLSAEWEQLFAAKALQLGDIQ